MPIKCPRARASHRCCTFVSAYTMDCDLDASQEETTVPTLPPHSGESSEESIVPMLRSCSLHEIGQDVEIDEAAESLQAGVSNSPQAPRIDAALSAAGILSRQAASTQQQATAAPWASHNGPTAEGAAIPHLPMHPPKHPPSHSSNLKSPFPCTRSMSPVGSGPVMPTDIVVPSMPAVFPLPLPPHFRRASKHITSEADLHHFLLSPSAHSFIAFLMSLGQAATGKKISDPCPEGSCVTALRTMLATLSTWVDEIPPLQQSLRYGNPAYRDWAAKLVANAEDLIRPALSAETVSAAPELAAYLCDSFGNSTRIDYGTGHETTFAGLLYCLARLGLLGDEDRHALVLRVFADYVALMRKVQTTYWLEPAGSHGVWGLDDYQFLPFMWGAAQLSAHPMIKPKSIHNVETMEAYSGEYLYLAAVQFVLKVKKGPLAETSPIIYDVSTVPTWAKVYSGMMKMYAVEVMSKVPIMQHFLFGTLLTFD